MFRKIIVALDIEDTCIPVFEKALGLAKATGAKLSLLGVLAPNEESSLPLLAYPGIGPYPTAASEVIWDHYQARYNVKKQSYREGLSRFEREAQAAGVQANFKQMVGDPGQAICDRAKAEKADLIVMGGHGRRGLKEFLIGSVSSYVMHRAPCCVLIVRDEPDGSNKQQSARQLSKEKTA